MSNIDFEMLETLAQASQDAYKAGNHNPDHYTLSERVEDPDTGFSVSIYGNDAGNSYIFAFSGTEMSVQDVFSDLTLGLSQWSKNSGDIKNLIDRYFSENDDPQLYLTGHSLGGALAQYAAYEYAMAYAISNPTVTAPFKLVTFNALGGELGLKNPDLYTAGYDESITQTINAAHYKITGDIFSRLGGDHIGGELLAIDRPVNTPLGAHPIAHFTTGLSGSGPVTLSEYQSANIEESYLRIDQALGVSGIMASYGDDGQYTEQEALLRTISALAFGLANTQPSELSELVVALFGDASTFGVEEHDAMVLVAEQAILRLQRSRLSVAGANGVAGYALLLANIMQDSTQYWAENPGFADAVGMPIDAFIEYIGKPAAGLISGAMDFALENEPLGEGSQEATLFISKTLEWIDNYVFGQPTNEMFIQGTEVDDVLLGKAAYWSWETSGDQMFGWGGDDTLDGGAGNDFLEGGSGADSFIWNTGGGNDVIGDYDDGGDRIIVNGIDLGSLEFRAAYGGSPFYRDIQHPELSLYYTGGFLTVNIDTGVDKGEITVTQYSPITGADYGIVLDDYVQAAPINTDITITQLGTGADEADPLAYWRQQSGQGGLDWSSLAIRFEAGTVANYSGGSLHGTLGGVFEGGPIADYLGGDARDNALHGLGGNDQILGNAGHDFLEGGSGSDELIGGEGSDILFGSSRAGLPDTLASADPYDQFYVGQITDGPADTNVLDGGAGNDFLSGGEGSDYLSGGTGINYLLGGAGRDHISGGDQQDVIYGDSALNYRYVELSPGVATEQLEIAFAGGTDPVGEYDDIVFAGDGNDIVWGELGDDDLHGGPGDDNLLGDRYNNTAYFNAELPADGLTSADLNVAMHGNDRLYGDAGNDLLLGLGGNDLLAGGPGSDSLVGGAGDDVYVFAPGDGLDSIDDTEGEHTLLFTAVDIDDLQVLFQGDQVLVGTGMGTEGFRLPRNSWANVRLAANTAEASFDRNRLDTHYLDSAGNVLISLQGANTLEASRDEMFRVDTSNPDSPGIVFGAGATKAEIVANVDGSATMRVMGGQLDLVVELAAAQIATGFDFLSLAEGMTVSLDGFAGSVTGTDGADIIFGSAASDSIFSGAGNDTLFGRGGDDLLDGGTGQDYIEGGAGDDVIQGGPGSDIISFNSGDGNDLLNTWSSSHPEHMGTISFAPDVDLSSLSFSFQNGDAVINYGENSQITLDTDTVFSFSDNVLNRFSLVAEADPDWIPQIRAQGYVGNFYGSVGADHIIGSANIETILPGYGDDLIQAGGNPDRIVLNDVYLFQATTGIGHKHIWGEGDNDTVVTPLHQGLTFHYQRGDGHDAIDYDWSYSRQHPYRFDLDYGASTAAFLPWGEDVLALGEGISLDDLQFVRMGDSLRIALADGSGSIQFNGFFHAWDAQPGTGVVDVGGLFGEGSQLASLLHPDVLGLLPRTPLAAIEFADGSRFDMASQLESALEYSEATLLGTEADDDLYGTQGNDVIHALGGNDSIEDLGGSNAIDAGTGNDRIVVAGDSRIEPGAGDDFIDIVAGAHVIQFGPGSGHDFTMLDVDSGSIVVELAGGITAADILVTLEPMEWGESPMITLPASGDTIVLAGLRFQQESEFPVGDTEGTGLAVHFADGTLVTVGELLGLAGTQTGELITGTNGKDILNGTAGDDSIFGERGRDTIAGLAGNDLIHGGRGNDILSGGAGNDSYLFEAGHGRDSIRNDDADPQALDVLTLENIAHEDVWLSRNRRHLFMNVAGTMDRVRIDNWYKTDAAQLDEIRAGDYVLMRDQVDQLVNAMAAFDVPQGVGVVIPDDVRAELEPTLASVWQLAG